MSKLPVTSLIPVLLAAAVLGNVAGKVLDDGKVNYADLGVLVGSLGEFSAFTALKPGVAFAEALDLDVAEKGEVVAAFKAKFDIADDVKESAIEELVDGSLLVLAGVVKVRVAGAVLLPSLPL